jgi:hypothetical protein
MIGCKRNVSYFVFEFINCTNVPPYSRDAPTLLTVTAPERAAQSLRVCREPIGKELQGDEAVQLGVFRFVHNAHAAATEFLEDAVMGNCAPKDR